jgi:hypothetical protein
LWSRFTTRNWRCRSDQPGRPHINRSMSGMRLDDPKLCLRFTKSQQHSIISTVTTWLHITMLALPLLLTMFGSLPIVTLAQPQAYSWSIVASPRSGSDGGCLNAPEWYQWRGRFGDTGCYNFGDEANDCVFVERTGSQGNGRPCGNGTPTLINNVQFEPGHDAEGQGCVFFDQPNCGGSGTRLFAQPFPNPQQCRTVFGRLSFSCGA